MNRILFEKEEIVNNRATISDERAEHILNFLHGEVGQILKTGEVNGPVGTSIIEEIKGKEVTLLCKHEASAPAPWVDLILAPPRPRAFKRLLGQLAQLGVGHIWLVGARKVEKMFWGATILKEEEYRPLLLEGLMQAGTSTLPTIHERRNFRKFLEEELDTLYEANTHKYVAHPYGESFVNTSTYLEGERILAAIGPEGGWTNEEVELLEAKGFKRTPLGPRILRTDTATVALLARLMDVGVR